jgi:hypothetical protein
MKATEILKQEGISPALAYLLGLIEPANDNH